MSFGFRLKGQEGARHTKVLGKSCSGRRTVCARLQGGSEPGMWTERGSDDWRSPGAGERQLERDGAWQGVSLGIQVQGVGGRQGGRGCTEGFLQGGQCAPFPLLVNGHSRVCRDYKVPTRGC